MGISLNANTTSGAIIATKEIGGEQIQKVLIVRDETSATGGVSPTNPLPVSISASVIVTGGVAISGSASVVISSLPAVSITGSVAANLGTIAGAVSGSEMQVDVITMPTTTVTGTVSITGSHSVIVSTIPAVSITGSVATNLGTIAGAIQAEDAVHTTGDTGIMALGVRQDTQSDFGADGDYVPP